MNFKTFPGFYTLSLVIVVLFIFNTRAYSQNHAMNAMRAANQAHRTHVQMHQNFMNMVMMNSHNKAFKKNEW